MPLPGANIISRRQSIRQTPLVIIERGRRMASAISAFLDALPTAPDVDDDAQLYFR